MVLRMVSHIRGEIELWMPVVHSFHFAVSCHIAGLLSGLPMALSKAGTSSLCLLVEADINATNSLYVNFEKTLEDVKYILF